MMVTVTKKAYGYNSMQISLGTCGLFLSKHKAACILKPVLDMCLCQLEWIDLWVLHSVSDDQSQKAKFICSDRVLNHSDESTANLREVAFFLFVICIDLPELWHLLLLSYPFITFIKPLTDKVKLDKMYQSLRKYCCWVLLGTINLYCLMTGTILRAPLLYDKIPISFISFDSGFTFL